MSLGYTTNLLIYFLLFCEEWGGFMPNYEELYYIARNKYNQAVEERNRIRNNTIELQSEKNRLTNLLAEKQSAFKAIQDKKGLIQDALDKCRHILDEEYPNMKKDLQMTGEEYKKIITSDMGVADLESIYATDLQSTLNDLNNIVTELNRILKNLESQEATAQNELNNCNSELSTVTSKLNNVGSEASAQYRIDTYYTEMKEYEARWQNGE